MSSRKQKGVFKRLIISAVLLVAIIALTALKSNSYIAEHIFTKGISRAYIYVVGNITGLLPFSLFEFLVGMAILAIIIAIFRWITHLYRRQMYKFFKGITTALTMVLAVVLLYTAAASFSYYRNDINGHIPTSQVKPEKAAVMAMTNYFIEDFNTLAQKMQRDKDGNVVCPYTFDQLAKKMQQEMQRLDSDYFNSYTPKAKRIVSGDIMGAFGILGISFQPTAEANISVHTVAIDLPALIAHELAHSKGVMRESDAVFVSAYITLTSTDDYIRYSGYCNYYGNISQFLTLNDIKKDYIESGFAMPSKLIDADYAYRYQMYTKYPDIIDEVGNFFNNIYLKLSGVKDGTDSYNVKGDITIIVPPKGDIKRIVNYSTIQKMLIAHYNQVSLQV